MDAICSLIDQADIVDRMSLISSTIIIFYRPETLEVQNWHHEKTSLSLLAIV
jgi:hypothetical protein